MKKKINVMSVGYCKKFFQLIQAGFDLSFDNLA